MNDSDKLGAQAWADQGGWILIGGSQKSIKLVLNNTMAAVLLIHFLNIRTQLADSGVIRRSFQMNRRRPTV